MPEPLIDVVEPFFRVIVELGYDRSIQPWEPTPARLIPPLNPAKVATDLVNAIGEGINNAAALVGVATAAEHSRAGHSCGTGHRNRYSRHLPQVTSKDTPTQTEQVTSTGRGDGNPAGVDGPAPQLWR